MTNPNPQPQSGNNIQPNQGKPQYQQPQQSLPQQPQPQPQQGQARGPYIQQPNQPQPNQPQPQPIQSQPRPAYNPNTARILSTPPSSAASVAVARENGPKINTVTWILIVVVAALIFGAGGFFLGRSTAPASPASSYSRYGMRNRNGGTGSGSGSGGMMGGFGARGTVTKVDGDTITIKEADGTTVTVQGSSSTPVTVTSKGKISDLKSGDTVTVIGQNDNGTISSPQSIMEGQIGLGGMRGSFSGGNGGSASNGNGSNSGSSNN
ncbi:MULTISPECIES: hypothetical protein [Bifidobacterium]|jgi:hypothetical protein|uniref:DUF5666 domain-containing protein n=1 Tax=Bifidobacterium tibiigranuli TaxID=2172043 RepID=A0A5N6S8B8_9BIFI|nr:hypothetical protein [Bifidobacterium tibiigranuli]KAE8129176.1 hypothetical protein DDE84_03615 [Bifidobacterium tibiigranuli]KAE8129414.1 hypothetical protein DDF78_03405 [Bifidobacterium tibiigranuli]